MAARFNLRNKQENDTSIILIFRYKVSKGNSRKLVMSTQRKINPKFWSKSGKATAAAPQSGELNAWLRTFADSAEKIHLRYLNAKELHLLTIPVFKHEISKSIGWIKQKSFLEYIFEFYEKKRDSLKSKKSAGDLYKNLHRNLKAFSAKYGAVEFGSIDMLFFDNFVNFLYGNDMSQNTAARRIKAIKTVLKQAESEGIKVNPTYKSRAFHLKETRPYKIYLTEQEIKEIYDLDLSQNSKLERSRDLFVVGCWTGLRFSDYSRIKPEHIKEDTIVITPKKTMRSSVQPISIPLHPLVRVILNKYKYQLPKVLPQKLNMHIKDIAEMAEITAPQIVVRNKGGKAITENLSKSKMVCSHTARRSFATNMFLLRYATIEIMKITGHTTESSFMKYICITGEENARKIAETPTFSRKLKAI